MKRNVLLVLLGAIMASLTFNLAHALRLDKFTAAVTKPVPGQPKHVMLFKMAAEIPEFKQAAAKDKSEWNSLVKQVNDQTMSGIEQEKRMKQLTVMQKFEKLKNTLSAKSKQLSQAIDKIVENNPRIRKLTSEKERLEKRLEPLKEQQKSLREKTFNLFTKIMSLTKEINTIKNEAKKSEDFPEDLRKLNTEVEQLQTEFKELSKRAWELQKEAMKKVDLGKLMEIGMKLRVLFNKMTKK